jgi:hypothetical protein
MAMKQEGKIKVQTTRRDVLKFSATACASPLAVFNIEARALAAPFYGEPENLPANELRTWGKEPIEARTSHRATICLNGIWRVMPAATMPSKNPPPIAERVNEFETGGVRV